MPTAAIDRLRRVRLKGTAGQEGRSSDWRVDAFWQDCEREDLATHVGLASFTTNNPMIKERSWVR
jgi:hypothetical protein